MTENHPSWRPETLQLHAGYEKAESAQRSRAVPIYQTTSFVFNDSQHGADLFGLKEAGAIYSRIGNPTVEVLEQRITALEGGAAAVATASGQSAQFQAIGAIAQSGDNIVATTALYGGTVNQLKVLFKRFGIEARFVNSDDPAEFAKRIDANTKALYIESLGNPKGNVFDIPALAKVANEHKVPLIVDDTLTAVGTMTRPFDLGAHIIVSSLTKYAGGHGTSLGGIIVDSGNFDWAASGRFPDFTTPAESYHGLVFTEALGKVAFAGKVRLELLRDLGACISPFNAWLILQGLETLTLRVERHCENALVLAKWLEAHPSVGWVSYLGLPSHPYHQLALKTFANGKYGGFLTFGVRDDQDGKKGAKVVDSLILHSNLANIGDAKSLVIHPASTTHSQLTADEQLASGVSPDLIRVSVGIEHIDDIIADYKQAFEKAALA
ncbi:hypothetical protein JCM3775_001041 [Rhodotorula graminis]